MGQQIGPLEKNTKSTFIIVFDFCIEFLMGQKFLFINNQSISKKRALCKGIRALQESRLWRQILPLILLTVPNECSFIIILQNKTRESI